MYQLEIKQIVDYPRCRIYRSFIRQLAEDKNIRTHGSSNLFYYLTLCSYANFRTSYKHIEGTPYLVYPGEWICRPGELTKWFRCRFHYQAIKILEHLRRQDFLSYQKLDHGKLIKYKIKGWKNWNCILEYNAPCQKSSGFFFFPIAAVVELLSNGKCSEMDIVLDLWINAVYNDTQVQASEIGSVVYFRNGTGNPSISYFDLSRRWNISKSSTGRILKKLQDRNYITLLSFPGRHGSVIYLNNYLSVMFDLSDTPIDKDEVAMSLKINVDLPTSQSSKKCDNTPVSVPDKTITVPDEYMDIAVKKVAEVLSEHGVACCLCDQTKYKLLELYDCKEMYFKYLLKIDCPSKGTQYKFLLRLEPLPQPDCHAQNYSGKESYHDQK